MITPLDGSLVIARHMTLEMHHHMLQVFILLVPFPIVSIAATVWNLLHSAPPKFSQYCISTKTVAKSVAWFDHRANAWSERCGCIFDLLWVDDWV